MSNVHDLLGLSDDSSSATGDNSDDEINDSFGLNGNDEDTADDDTSQLPVVETTKNAQVAVETDKNAQVVETNKNAQVVATNVQRRDCSVANKDSDDESGVMTQRDWQRKFSKQNRLYKRCKIRYSDFCYIKPRCAIPATGKPILYVAEGAENWTGSPNLLCAGQCLKCDSKDWVIIVVLWVGCLARQRPNGAHHYSPVAKQMQVLLCPHKAFDAADEKLGSAESELRYVYTCFLLCLYFQMIYLRCLQSDVGVRFARKFGVQNTSLHDD